MRMIALSERFEPTASMFHGIQKISFPPAMADLKKTTLVKYQGAGPKWYVLEDGVDSHVYQEVWDVDKM
eukprot:2378530-Karenia_brevis.AAC.1